MIIDFCQIQVAASKSWDTIPFPVRKLPLNPSTAFSAEANCSLCQLNDCKQQTPSFFLAPNSTLSWCVIFIGQPMS